MFYIHGKLGRNRMKISEVEAYWSVLHPYFYVFHVELPPAA
jgi:hypothetical protein